MWQVRSLAEKESVQRNKNLIQDRLKNEIGLVIDMPNALGFGTLNNGNSSRRFFRIV